MTARTAIVAACLLVVAGLLWLLMGLEPPPPQTEISQEQSSDAGSLQGDLGSNPETAVRETDPEADRAQIVGEAPRGTGDLEVHVLWRDDRSPIANLTLKLGQGMADAYSPSAPTLTTDHEGVATLSDVPPAAYALYATRDMWTNAEVVAGDTREVEMLLERHGHFRVSVVDEEGQPISGADVHAVGMWLLGNTHVGQTDDDGQLEFDAMAPNVTVFAGATARGRSQPYEIVSFPGDEAEVTLTLGDGAQELVGWVVDEAGQPVPGAVVTVSMSYPRRRTASWPDGEYAFNSKPVVVTDAEGRFRLPNTNPGALICEVRAAGFLPRIESFELWNEEVRVTLSPGAQVVGVIRSLNGDPVDHAMVQPTRAVSPQEMTHTDENGRFRLPSLEPGSIGLWASHPDHGEARAELEVLTGETILWEPRLDPGGVIEGQVVDGHDQPLSGLTVEIVGGGPRMNPRTLTSRDGRFRVMRPRDDVYQVKVLDSPTFNSQTLERLDGVSTDGEPLRIVIRQADRPSAFLTGRFVRPRGFEEHLVRLGISNRDRGGTLRYGVGTEGSFRIGPLVPGTYELGLDPYNTPLRGIDVLEVRLGPGAEVDVGVIEIPPPTWLDVEIRYPDGQPAEEEFTIMLFDIDGTPGGIQAHWVRGTLMAAAYGLYEPGRFTLRVMAKGFLPWSREIELIEGRTTKVQAVVERAREVRLILDHALGMEAPQTVQVALRRETPPHERTLELRWGEGTATVGLGTYLAEIRDDESRLSGSVRFTISDLDGPELQIRLFAR